MHKGLFSFLVACASLAILPFEASASPQDYFAIHVVDDQTGRGVPLVRLQTTNAIRYYTDSSGYVAFNEPGLMNTDVWFSVSTDGYECPADGMGFRGIAVQTKPGGSTELKLHRINIAERLYRTTGEGIYRDTVLLGKITPIANGLLNGQVMGQDTVQTAIYHGKMFWLWGDTEGPYFPLGNFHTSGAASDLPKDLNPDRGINFEYFVGNDGFCRGMAELERNDNLPVWLDAMMVVNDKSGQPRLFARYAATKDMKPVEQGLVLFDDARQVFVPFLKFQLSSRLIPGSHPTRVRDNHQEYFYFPSPYAVIRVLADYAHVTNPSAYEGYTCIKPGTSFSKEHPLLNRAASEKLIWQWQTGANPVSQQDVSEWVERKLLRREETPFQMRNIENGESIDVAGGSIAWNPLLKKWTFLFNQLGGDSNLGEVWFAVANSPEGPWRDAIKVATHAKKDDNNDFYNPMQHPEFSREGGRYIYFEGTYVNTFSGNPNPTPRYNYNNIMYRLDVTDPRLAFPEPPPAMGVHVEPIPDR